MFSTTFCSRACCGAPEEANAPAVHHHVVLHVLDDQCAARRIERQAGVYALARSARSGRDEDGADDDTLAVVPEALDRMKGSTRGPILVRTA